VNRQQVPGLWYELERWIQDDLVRDGGGEAWVFAGCIFGPSQHEKVGPNHDIWVPPMFYKIVITDWPEGARPDGVNHPLVLAYLFPHQRVRHGELDAFLTSVNVIEALAGVDFFQDRDDEDQLEDVDTWEWVQVLYEQD
jgi:DNA/RNA endonuclease G (NUC1)